MQTIKKLIAEDVASSAAKLFAGAELSALRGSGSDHHHRAGGGACPSWRHQAESKPANLASAAGIYIRTMQCAGACALPCGKNKLQLSLPIDSAVQNEQTPSAAFGAPAAAVQPGSGKSGRDGLY